MFFLSFAHEQDGEDCGTVDQQYAGADAHHLPHHW